MFKTTQRAVIAAISIISLTSASTHAIECNKFTPWLEGAAFLKGDLVRFKGIAYEAQWFSLGEQPDVRSGQFDVWKSRGVCAKIIDTKCDFNGDGRLDVARGFPFAHNRQNNIDGIFFQTGQVAITYGPGNPDEKIDVIWDQNILGMSPYAREAAHFGDQLSVGDFNNDNFCDLAISSPGFSYRLEKTARNKGLVNVLYGSPDGLTIVVRNDAGRPVNPIDAQRFDQDSPNIPGVPEAGDLFGGALIAGDFNDDGYDDLAIGAPGEGISLAQLNGEAKNAGYFHILFGSRLGIQTGAPKTVAYTQQAGGVGTQVEAGDRYGAAFASADFDSDGYVDLAVSAPGEDEARGRISLFRGASVGLDTSSRIDFGLENILPGLNIAPGTSFGYAMKTIDFNADGFWDLEVSYLDNSGNAQSIRVGGSASGLVINNQ